MSGRSPARARGRFAAPLVAAAGLAALGAPSAAGAVQREQALDWRDFVGRWTDENDCAIVTFLRRDGQFIAPNGAVGRWGVAGRRLKLSGPGGIVTWRVELDGRDTIILISDDGTRSRSTRCGAGERPRPI